MGMLIRKPSAVWVPCYTEPLSKVRLWIQISWASNEQEQFVEKSYRNCRWAPIVPILIMWNGFSDGIHVDTD